jgi:general secretion pathway protein C
VLDTYFKQYFWTFHLAVLFVAALLVAWTVNAFVGAALMPAPEKLTTAAPPAARRPNGPAPEQAISLSAFLERNVFKAMREDLAAQEAAEAGAEEAAPADVFDPESCERSTISATLLGTLVASDPSRSLAVFQDPGAQRTVTYTVGERVLDQAEIHSIDWRTVRVNKGGRCEVFSLEEPEQPAVATAAEAAPPPAAEGEGNFGNNVKKVSETEFEIPRQEIDGALSNLNQLATQARIVPNFQNGKANGFKLFSIRPNSLYSKIGIQNGDIIQKINGYEINGPDKALEIYNKLKDAQNITVDLVRRGKSQTLSYNIR